MVSAATKLAVALASIQVGTTSGFAPAPRSLARSTIPQNHGVAARVRHLVDLE
jgi:hypothetical protein